MAGRQGVRVAYLLTERGSRRVDREAWFRPESLARLVPDLIDRTVYVCGPELMLHTLRKSLGQLGVPSGQIRAEVFRLQ